MRWLNRSIDWCADMIARWLNHACSWWCAIPGWPYLTAAIAVGVLVGAYAIAWSR